GEHGEAGVVYRQALGEVDAGDSRLRSTVLRYLAVWSARTGELERARQFFDEAVLQCRTAGEPAVEAEVLLDQAFFYCYRRGLFQEAMSLVGRAAIAAGISGDLTLEARCRLLGGLVFLRLGNPDEALGKFRSLRQLYNAGGETSSLTGVVALLGEAEAHLMQNSPDYQQAEHLYRRAADELSLVEPSLEAELLLALGRSAFFRFQGETGRAMEEARRALEIVRGVSDGWLEAVVRLNLAAAGITAGGENLAAGLRWLEEATVVFAAWEDGYHSTLADLWRFWGNFQATGETDHTLLQQCRRHIHKFLSLPKIEKELSRLILEHSLVTETRASLGVKTTETAPKGVAHEPVIEPSASGPPRLRINCLGPFHVYRGGQLLDERCWSRRKGKTLLKFLALHLGQKVPRDVIVDLLWPALPSEKAANAFYVTLHALRKTLNTGLSREIDYVVVRDGMIYLEPGLVEELDVEAFNRACTLAFKRRETGADEALAHLKEARRLYRGDLLAEDAYAVWPAAARERLRRQYLKVLVALAEKTAGAGRVEDALELWQEVVEREPLHEEGQREIIRILSLQGQRAEARQRFLKNRRLLKKEVGSEPGEEILRLYRRILNLKLLY
ncbi:MAG: hypothetical protein K6T80_08245, partial [Firmicutes bacterium]|nr:hypothetical protein [Bacillota bacterium]